MHNCGRIGVFKILVISHYLRLEHTINIIYFWVGVHASARINHTVWNAEKENEEGQVRVEL